MLTKRQINAIERAIKALNGPFDNISTDSVWQHIVYHSTMEEKPSRNQVRDYLEERAKKKEEEKN